MFLPHKSALIGYHIHFPLSRTFLFFFQSFQCVLSRLESNGEGGIWTLAPLLTTYSLSRVAPSASLGTSPKCPRIIHAILFSLIPRLSFVVICLNLLSCACAPSRKTKGSPFNSELPKRRGWDSNPRALSDKRFSRPPRYDHFDTSPNFLSFHRLNCLVRPRDNVYSSIILSEMSTPFFHFFYFFLCDGH